MNPSRPAPAIAHDLQMQVVLDDNTRVALTATLQYSASDPFATSATFRTGDGDITWVFARDLLRDGLGDAVGEGDIHIRPGHPSRGANVIISLTSPSGTARIEAARGDLVSFVDDVYTAVPSGSEWMYLDFDAELSELLGADPLL